MQTVFKILITEVIGIILGLLICLVRADEPVPDKAGLVGATMVVLSAIALLITGLWWVWSQ